jgi:hypothetical protein
MTKLANGFLCHRGNPARVSTIGFNYDGQISALSASLKADTGNTVESLPMYGCTPARLRLHADRIPFTYKCK